MARSCYLNLFLKPLSYNRPDNWFHYKCLDKLQILSTIRFQNHQVFRKLSTVRMQFFAEIGDGGKQQIPPAIRSIQVDHFLLEINLFVNNLLTKQCTRCNSNMVSHSYGKVHITRRVSYFENLVNGLKGQNGSIGGAIRSCVALRGIGNP